MRNVAAKFTFIILTFNITFINKSHGDNCVGLVYFQSLVGLRLLPVVYFMN